MLTDREPVIPAKCSFAALTHKPQLHLSVLESDCRQAQHDELDNHDCVRRLEEMVNVIPSLLLP